MRTLMDRTTATKFATQFLNHWGIDPNHNRLEAWCELLATLNPTAVRHTADLMRKSNRERPPSPADFHNAYQATRKRQPGPTCTTCNGEGWISSPASEHPQHWPGSPDTCPPKWSYVHEGITHYGCDCHVATPCTSCTTGELAKETHGRIHRKRTAVQQ